MLSYNYILVDVLHLVGRPRDKAAPKIQWYQGRKIRERRGKQRRRRLRKRKGIVDGKDLHAEKMTIIGRLYTVIMGALLLFQTS